MPLAFTLAFCTWRYRRGPCTASSTTRPTTRRRRCGSRPNLRLALHFTPTRASWLNQVECWFSILSRKALRRGSFETKEDLQRALLRFIVHSNKQVHPFDWAYSEELIHDQVRLALLRHEDRKPGSFRSLTKTVGREVAGPISA
jgi:hypothetical protein